MNWMHSTGRSNKANRGRHEGGDLAVSTECSLPGCIASYAVAYWLQPFLPDTSARVTTALTSRPIRAAAPLFPRVV